MLSMQIAVDCRFDRATLDVETVRYFFDDEDTRDALDDESVNRVPPALLRHLGFFSIRSTALGTERFPSLSVFKSFETLRGFRERRALARLRFEIRRLCAGAAIV